MRVVALWNVMAGGADGDAVENVRTRLLAAFANTGISAELEAVPAGEYAARTKAALERTVAHEIDAVVVCGGDGTIRTVAAALAGTDVPMGIVPLGTFNHFAKDVGLPLDIDGAVNVIAASHIRAVDAGEVNGHVFVNNSSIGVYPYMVLDREKRRRKGLRKWVAMIFAAIKVLRLFPVRRLRIQIENESELCRTPCLFVGNNRYRLDLFALGKRERLDEGRLWLYIANQQTRLSLLWFTFRSLIGMTNPARDLHIFSVKTAIIHARTSRLNVTMDGEVEWMRPPLHYRIRPAALRVYAPARAEPS